MKKRNKSATMICSMILITLSLFVANCSQNSSKQSTSYKTQTYYPEKWETDNFPDYHLEIVQFHHEDKCDTCTFLQNSIIELLNTTYAQEAEEGIIIYHSIMTNYAENTPIKQEFSVMEEDLCSSIYIKGKHQHIEIWRDLFLAADEDPVYAKELLQQKIEKRIEEARKIENRENP
ncbi:MAG: hypothetical protein PHX86_03155 [Caldisericia bacterium]|nr:hypothetical protein [Caldisericia bacterium]